MAAPVVVLTGGTGGAKLARGLLDEVEELVVIANTGDDVEIHGGHVSPDPDLVTFWLADRIDERGWGLREDTFHVMDGLRELGEDVWFNLGDRDLALCVRRARRLAEGARLTEAIDEARRAYGVGARVLPASDDPVRTHVKADGRWWPFQEFMIRHRAQGPVEDVEFRGAADAAATPEVLDALAGARAIVIGPSNPVISIGPMLAVPGLRDALAAAEAPVVAVSPLVARRGAQGADGRLHGARRRAADGGRDRGALRGADRRARGRRARGRRPDAGDRRADGRRRRPAPARARDAGLRRRPQYSAMTSR